MEKSYKTEAQSYLFHVVLNNGSYSEYFELHYLFSGNSEEEVWEYLKIFFEESKTDTCTCLESPCLCRFSALIWEDRKYKRSISDEDCDTWDTDTYGECFNVSIYREHVIYVNPQELLTDYKDEKI